MDYIRSECVEIEWDIFDASLKGHPLYLLSKPLIVKTRNYVNSLGLKVILVIFSMTSELLFVMNNLQFIRVETHKPDADPCYHVDPFHPVVDDAIIKYYKHWVHISQKNIYYSNDHVIVPAYSLYNPLRWTPLDELSDFRLSMQKFIKRYNQRKADKQLSSAMQKYISRTNALEKSINTLSQLDDALAALQLLEKQVHKIAGILSEKNIESIVKDIVLQ